MPILVISIELYLNTKIRPKHTIAAIHKITERIRFADVFLLGMNCKTIDKNNPWLTIITNSISNREKLNFLFSKIHYC